MLKLHIPSIELYDEFKNEFIYLKDQDVELEHSLVAISKWESLYCKPFLTTKMTKEEMLAYIRCMVVSDNVDDNFCYALTPDDFLKINNYMNSNMTATWFKEGIPNKRNHEIITSEIIYYWMCSYNIPTEYDKWNINRLLTLIRVISEKNKTNKRMSKSETLSQNRELNELRKRKYNTRG